MVAIDMVQDRKIFNALFYYISQYQCQQMKAAGGFDMESALHQLLSYATQYSEPVSSIREGGKDEPFKCYSSDRVERCCCIGRLHTAILSNENIESAKNILQGSFMLINSLNLFMLVVVIWPQ